MYPPVPQPGGRCLTINVVIADDHPVVRAGLRQILGAEADVWIVAEVADGDALLHALAGAPVDVVLLDVTMPGAPFPTLLRDVKTLYPRLRVLVLSMQPEDQFAVRALRDGAAGYLSKDRSPQELVAALRTIVQGGTYVSAALAEQLATALDPGRAPIGHEALSDREHEVLRLIGAGKAVREIAIALSLSPKTVSTYRTRILEKLGLRTSAELIRYALQHQLTS
jgi:DNA-binding NarL/FixJ family response regulator